MAARYKVEDKRGSGEEQEGGPNSKGPGADVKEMTVERGMQVRAR